MLYRLYVVLAGVFLFTSCGRKEDDPISVIGKFLHTVDQHDFKAAEKYITADYRPSLENMRMASSDIPIRENKYKCVLGEHNDTAAAVDVMLAEMPPGVSSPELSSFVATFHLKNIGGEWLIDRQQ